MTKILLVEDDKSLREIYGVRLLAEGYEIVSAGDGEEALAVAIKERPQLIISDVMMPKISGFDMLDILRSTTETKDIKVIMMTALSSEDQRTRGESLGADRYLVKSQVGIEDVVRTVHDVLGDGVSTPQSAAQTFGTPPPSAVPTPPVASPTRPAPAAPTSAPVAVPEAPSSPTPTQPTPATPPRTSPVINAPPAVPTPSVPQPAVPSPQPQPEPPYSVNTSSSLGDRVIHPLTEQPPTVDIGNLMSQELSAATTPPKPNTPPTPTPPAPSAAPQPAPPPQN